MHLLAEHPQALGTQIEQKLLELSLELPEIARKPLFPSDELSNQKEAHEHLFSETTPADLFHKRVHEEQNEQPEWTVPATSVAIPVGLLEEPDKG